MGYSFADPGAGGVLSFSERLVIVDNRFLKNIIKIKPGGDTCQVWLSCISVITGLGNGLLAPKSGPEPVMTYQLHNLEFILVKFYPNNYKHFRSQKHIW